VIAVDVGRDYGPSDADARINFAPDEEVAALALARAEVIGAGAGAERDSLGMRASRLVDLLRNARYVAVVADGEPAAGRDPQRGEALLLLVEALNMSSRGALSTLRGGGNRSGAESVMTWQTGFPMTVDFVRGAPSYRPDRPAAALLESREVDVAVVVGAPQSVPPAVARGLANGVSCIAIGPYASQSPYPVTLAIDTGIAGIHERGTAVRMDEVPLPLRPALEAPQDTLTVLRAVTTAIARRAPRTGAAARA
jgi:formylmethanofuran dehydrogenase subunit B